MITKGRLRIAPQKGQPGPGNTAAGTGDPKEAVQRTSYKNKEQQYPYTGQQNPFVKSRHPHHHFKDETRISQNEIIVNISICDGYNKHKGVIAIRIRDLREDSDLTQQQIADYLHIRQNTYCQYETGNRQIPLTLLIALAYFYNTSTDYLLGITDEKKPYKRKGK